MSTDTRKRKSADDGNKSSSKRAKVSSPSSSKYKPLELVTTDHVKWRDLFNQEIVRIFASYEQLPALDVWSKLRLEGLVPEFDPSNPDFQKKERSEFWTRFFKYLQIQPDLAVSARKNENDEPRECIDNMACLLQGLVHASMKDKETHDETLELVEHLRQSIAQADIERKKFVDEAVEANVRAHEAEKAAQADREILAAMVDDHKSQVAAWRKRRDQDETARQAFEEELEKVRHDHKQVMIERNDMKQQLEDTTKTLNRSKTETTDLVMALKKADETMRRLEQERPNNNEGLQLECDRRQAELLKVLHLKDELHQQVLDFKKAHELLWAGTQDADRERVKWFKTAEKLQAQVIDLESKLEQEKKVYIESFNANREFRADTRKQLAVMDQKMDMLADNTFALAKQRDDLLHQLEQEQQVVKHLQESVESMVVTHDKTCNLLRASKDEAQKMLENAKARITELEVAHAEVQKQLDDAKARITELEATQVTAQKWADDAIARASQFEGRVKELQHECEEAKKESKDLVDYLQGRITNLQAAWSESDLQNEGLRGKLQAMEDDLDIAKANRTEAVGKMEAARAHTQELEEKLRKSQEEATSLGDGAQHIIAEYKAAKEEMKLHLDEANKNVDYWTTQALEARKRLREYEQKFDSRVDELTRQLEELKQSTEEKVEEIQRRCAEEVMVLVKKHWFTPAAEPCRIDDLAVVLPENKADFEAHGYWIGRVTELSYHKGKNIPHAFRVAWYEENADGNGYHLTGPNNKITSTRDFIDIKKYLIGTLDKLPASCAEWRAFRAP